MDRVHRGGPWTGSMGWSMDRVHRGGPWTQVHVLYTSLGDKEECSDSWVWDMSNLLMLLLDRFLECNFVSLYVH